MRGSNELQAVGLFLAFDGASTCTDPFTSGKKYRKSVNIAVNKSLFFVSTVATSAFRDAIALRYGWQTLHTPTVTIAHTLQGLCLSFRQKLSWCRLEYKGKPCTFYNAPSHAPSNQNQVPSIYKPCTFQQPCFKGVAMIYWVGRQYLTARWKFC